MKLCWCILETYFITMNEWRKDSLQFSTYLKKVQGWNRFCTMPECQCITANEGFFFLEGDETLHFFKVQLKTWKKTVYCNLQVNCMCIQCILASFVCGVAVHSCLCSICRMAPQAAVSTEVFHSGVVWKGLVCVAQPLASSDESCARQLTCLPQPRTDMHVSCIALTTKVICFVLVLLLFFFSKM